MKEEKYNGCPDCRITALQPTQYGLQSRQIVFEQFRQCPARRRLRKITGYVIPGSFTMTETGYAVNLGSRQVITHLFLGYMKALVP